MARTGKPLTIVENFILPAAAIKAGIMLGEKSKKTMPSSNNTVSRCNSDMTGDVLKQLLLCIQASELYAFQLDESTDVAWHSSWCMSVTFFVGQLRKTSSSA